VPFKIMKPVPVVNLVHAEMDQIALGTRTKTTLSRYEELEKLEDRMKVYIADRIVEATGYWKQVLQRIYDFIIKLDEVQDIQIGSVLNDTQKIILISRFENQILKPLDIQSPRPKRPQLPLWRDAA
jgi:hypothetical protein